ncbi:uncharacterized protein LOC144336321 [Macaca mulatta]
MSIHILPPPLSSYVYWVYIRHCITAIKRERLDQSTVLSPFLVSLVPQIPTPSSRACFDYPAGRDTWRPNRDLETRDSVRKRTPKDGRPLTKTKGIKLITAGTCRVRIEENEA